jgi:hypothetical protein
MSVKQVINLKGKLPDGSGWYDFDLGFNPAAEVNGHRVWVSLRTERGESYTHLPDAALLQIREAIDRHLGGRREGAARIYRGVRSATTHEARVSVEAADTLRALSPRYDLAVHSAPSFAFDWGNARPGSVQLALGILADCLNDDDRARALYQEFAGRIIANMKGGPWELSDVQVREVVATIERERAAKGGA